MITLSNVSKNFGDNLVVDDLSLEIGDGEFVVMLGPSGCGKTTTLRMLAGLEDVTSGEIFVGGQPVSNVPVQHRDLAMVFQSYALYPHMTIAENISYPLRVRKVDKDERARRTEAVAVKLGIQHLLKRKPRQLSGGERQRVALARAIVREPRAYLMDEPLSNLDARLRFQMRAELKKLQQQLGTTTVYVTHDQLEAMTLAHRVAVLDRGRLQQFDTPMNIYNQPANRFVAEFVGNPSMNFIEGRIDQQRQAFVNEWLAIPLSELQLAQLAVGQSNDVTLGIRPEHVHLSLTAQTNAFGASVYVTELMGSETLVFLALGPMRLVSRARADFAAVAESQVWVTFSIEHAHFFQTTTGRRM